MAFLKEVYPEQSRFYNDTTIGEKDGDQNESLETRNRINIQYINDIKLTKNKYDTLDEESLREMKALQGVEGGEYNNEAATTIQDFLLDPQEYLVKISPKLRKQW